MRVAGSFFFSVSCLDSRDVASNYIVPTFLGMEFYTDFGVPFVLCFLSPGRLRLCQPFLNITCRLPFM